MVVVDDVHQNLLVALNAGPHEVLLEFSLLGLVLEGAYIQFLENRKLKLVHRLRKLSGLLREGVNLKLLPPSLAKLPAIPGRSLRSS